MFNNHLQINKDKTMATWGIFGPGLLIPEMMGVLILIGFIINILQSGFQTAYIAPFIIGLFVSIVAFQRDYWVFDNIEKTIVYKSGEIPFVKVKEVIKYDDVNYLDIKHFRNDKGKAMMSFYLILNNGEKVKINEVPETVSKQKIERSANMISIITGLSFETDREIQDNKDKRISL